MKKIYLIYIFVGLIAISLYIYIYLFFIPGKLGFDEEINPPPPGQIQQEIEKEQDEDLMVEDRSPQKVYYDYRKTARNPFNDYRVKPDEEKDISSAVVTNKDSNKVRENEIVNEKIIKEKNRLRVVEARSNIPFELTGIIGNEERRIAIIKTRNGSQLVEKGDSIQGYKITLIKEEYLTIDYQGIEITLTMGGWL